ncbi:MAG: DEAD/DEAH box helicase [Pseudomonadota bacterium]
MASTSIESSLWLPGLEPEAAAFPDLFVRSNVSTKAPRAVRRLLPYIEPIVPPPASPKRWPTLTDEMLDAFGGPVWKYEANIAAIKLLREIEAAQRSPSMEERLVLQHYTGWGGIPASFNQESRDAGWMERARQLQAMLTDAEYESARASVNNSHYTEIPIIEAMWQAVRNFGFQGGRILDPCAGIGHFLGAMPTAIADNSQVTAIEIDALSGRILKELYASYGVDVRISPFEKTALADNWFDLAISNVPFGKYQVPDMMGRPYGRFNIHNYFFGRALDLVRPGGLVCFITSVYTLDAHNESQRCYFASQAELIGAIRLPKGAFARIASTEAPTDILFFRKRRHGEKVREEDWLELVSLPKALQHPRCYATNLFINEWYAKHPPFVIGQVTRESNGYSEVPITIFEGDVKSALHERINQLPVGVYQSAVASEIVAAAPSLIPVPAHNAKPGSYRLHQDRIHQVEGSEMRDVHDALNMTQRARIAGMIGIRDQVRALLDAQLSDVSDAELNGLRKDLSEKYDRFVAKLGFLSTRSNALAFRRDPDYPLLLSLEHYDEENGAATKAAVFSRRTLSRVTEPTTVEGPEEALAASMKWRGRIDAAYMAQLLNVSETVVLGELSNQGLIYCDPATGKWQTADEYLSGNVKIKLKQATTAGEAFLGNVEALKKVIPADIEAASIEPRLGAVWIPAADVEAFIREVLEMDDCGITYSALAGSWAVKYGIYSARQNVKVTQEFGTPRMNAIELIQCALNIQMPTVRDRNPVNDTYAINKVETLAAREKLALLKERFATWAFADAERRERLCRLYNDRFNAVRPRRFDGSHLKLPGFSQCFELHPHQKDAIWRVIQAGNTGLFHVVGAGKTAVCVASSMELRRLGFVKKPCHVVPNHMLEQYTSEFVRYYPGASVCMATKEDIAGDRRRELISRIATGDWDAVVMTHASFERLKVSPEYAARFIEDIIQEIEYAIRSEKRDRSNRIVKQLEMMKKNWQVKLERLLADNKKDDLLHFEALGIDAIYVDEAHLFKNLFRFTKMTRVAGLPLTSSERAFDLYVKTRYIMQVHGNTQRGVVFATATPVANTMAEIHTMMRYLQPNRLEELGLQQFDAWAATFGECVTALEIAPDGSGYRMNTRFARFINVPELMTIFGEIADIRTAEMLNLPVPKLEGDKVQVISCPPSDALKAYVQILVERAEAIRNGKVDAWVDNMLAITTDGRKAALDFRLVSQEAPFDPEGKVAACIREVTDIWRRTASFRGTQLVFCDLSSPKYGKAFSVYDDMKARLIAAGIPEKEIAFIHDADTDAQKATLFKAVREGRVRILFGSTPKMGVGTNVQTRLYALHHLDAPWRPCDVEQREGRILRQGNECDSVTVIRYVTAGSFDAYIWQTLETKARFIAQVMKGDQGIRSLEDVELATLSYAEVKALASGNPLIIEKAGVDAEVAKLSTLFTVWRNQRWTNESEVARLPKAIADQQRRLLKRNDDVARVQAVTMESFVVELNGRRIVGADAAAEVLREIIRNARQSLLSASRMVDGVIGKFGGFDLGITASRFTEIPNFYLEGQFTYDAEDYQQGPALVAALLACLCSVQETHDKEVVQLEAKRKRLEDLTRELQRPFEHEKRLAELIARQRELNQLLDINKDAVEGVSLESEDAKQAA